MLTEKAFKAAISELLIRYWEFISFKSQVFCLCCDWSILSFRLFSPILPFSCQRCRRKERLVITTLRLLRNVVSDEMRAVIASFKDCSRNILWQSLECRQRCLCEYLSLHSDSVLSSVNKRRGFTPPYRRPSDKAMHKTWCHVISKINLSRV